ncbi:MAG TPA: hypothetical protein VK666_27450 [Chryseolinea sp.]|nr:hypothetical protein [Chryseolinea sp.]
MSHPKKHTLIPAGDYMTAEEAAMDESTEIRRRCETIDEVVKDKIFTLPDALAAYDVSPREYIGYVLMSNTKKKVMVDQMMAIAMMSAIVSVLDLTRVDHRIEKVFTDLKRLATVNHK